MLGWRILEFLFARFAFCLINSYRTIVSNFTFSKVTSAFFFFFFDNMKVSLLGPIKSLNLVRVLKKKRTL